MEKHTPAPISLGSRRGVEMEHGPFQIAELWFPARELLPKHHHDRAVVGVTLSGEWDSILSSHRLENCSGVLHTEPAGDSHSNRFGNRGGHVLIIQPDSSSTELFRPFKSLLDSPQQVRSVQIRPLAQRIRQEIQQPDDLSPLAVEYLCMELLLAATRAERRTHTVPPSWLTRAVEYLRADIAEGKSVGTISVIAGVHPSHFARVFRQHYGVGPATYVRHLRLERAAQQLADTDQTLASIAVAVGFSDHSHFTRHFARHFGTSPSQYRRLHHQSRRQR
jgi:AraC family transcriptional regulator